MSVSYVTQRDHEARIAALERENAAFKAFIRATFFMRRPETGNPYMNYASPAYVPAAQALWDALFPEGGD